MIEGKIVGFSQWEKGSGPSSGDTFIIFTQGTRSLNRYYMSKKDRKVQSSPNSIPTVKQFCSARNPHIEFIYD